MEKYQPSYIRLLESGELTGRARYAAEMLRDCSCCPRQCSVDRYSHKRGFCRTGARVSVPHYGLHYGEEPPVTGIKGSGAVFFGNCNMRCIYCQNFQISQNPAHVKHYEITCEQAADIMLELQSRGAHNINLISPAHVIPQIIMSIEHAAQKGLTLPIVYNSNGYESVSSLKLLEGIIDIFLPDIKYTGDDRAVALSHAPDYTAINRAALKEMFRQAGFLKTDDTGVAEHGIIVRHLVLPHNTAGTFESLRFLVNQFSRKISVSIMFQYFPAYKARGHPLIGRNISPDEYESVIEMLETLKIENGWIQERESSAVFQPDFNWAAVFQ